ncbi:MAG TPA: hypothetical protein VLS46_03060, partial [Gaiellaceae bacterium]|nr:hypothetical protein [Gaiellaceae bacterium]
MLSVEARSKGSNEGAEFILIGMTPVRGQAQVSGPDGSSLVEILIGKDGTQALALPDTGGQIVLQLQGTDASGVAQIVTITLSAVQGGEQQMSV